MSQTTITDPLPDLSADQREMLAELFHLLGERNRLGIVLSCLDQAMAVGDIAASLGLSQSLVSHHLRLLRAARLLRGERRGKHVFYTAADEHVRCVVTDLANHVLEPGHSVED